MHPEFDLTMKRLESCGQSHVLSGWQDLDPARQRALLDCVCSLPLESLQGLVEQFVLVHDHEVEAKDISPPDVTAPDVETTLALAQRGEEIIREGRVAAFTVAGGQGTRLGWGGPKGTYPATPVSGKPLFRVFAEQIEAASRYWKTPIRWYIMTSEINDAATRSFFADNNWFGLPRTQVMLFPQGMMPCFDAQSGDLLMETSDRLAMSPDGHGGSITALHRSGALEQMTVLGIDTISYFQVDNPIAPVIDPVFIGLHADPSMSSGEMSSKMVPKIEPDEKVGVFCKVGDRMEVIEYSDMPEDLQVARDPQGRLLYDAGNIAVHLLGVDFAQRLCASDELPWHRALKKVPCVHQATGEHIKPDTPNGVKLERFIFDALPLASRSAVLQVDRAREFAPIKNAVGEDSPASCRQAQSDLYGGWLDARGVDIARDEQGHVLADIEISPLTAMGPEFLDPSDLPEAIGPGDRILL
ncbi:MAG: UDPGP type 1 family protein [Planctomycetota bacterium]|nr:UDPGP type 1 family protein [Planctomycetota bacterium]